MFDKYFTIKGNLKYETYEDAMNAKLPKCPLSLTFNKQWQIFM